MRPPADVMISAGLVRRLLAEQCPDLAAMPLAPVAEGWDNAVFRLGEHLAVRLPRRALAVDSLRNEQRWLPVLEPLVGVPVPRPLREGRPGAGYPWPWSVVPWFVGRPAAFVPSGERAALVDEIARVVAGLHVAAPPGAPRNPHRGGPLATRDTAVRERLASGRIPDAGRALEVWQQAVRAPAWRSRPLWLHGDLHPANMLVDSRGGLRAILDFGDLGCGDPATDLATAWLTFDAEGRARFRARAERLFGVDADTWLRARGWALVMATAMLTHAADDPVIGTIGVRTLAGVLDS